jgi:virginiamycin B lyase
MTSRVCPISQASWSKSFGASLLISAALLFSSQLALAQTEFPIPTPNSVPSGITVGPEVPVGALWFTETGDPALGPKVRGKIGRITTAGVITEFPIPTLNSAPNGITTGPDGALWFTETGANQIGRITTAGVVTEFPIPTANSNPISITTWSGVTCITGEPVVALWFTESIGNKIGCITTAGAIAEFPIPTTNSGPSGITTGPDGALWFTEGNGNKIGRIPPIPTVTPANPQITEFTIPLVDSGPQGITTGPDGALWFTQVGANKIGRMTVGGELSEFQIFTPFSVPGGITTGPDALVHGRNR